MSQVSNSMPFPCAQQRGVAGDQAVEGPGVPEHGVPAFRQDAGLDAPAAGDRRGHRDAQLDLQLTGHVDDVLAVLDREQAGPVWLAGASAGGGLALDIALLAPDRIAGLVLFGTAVSGAPEPRA